MIKLLKKIVSYYFKCLNNLLKKQLSLGDINSVILADFPKTVIVNRDLLYRTASLKTFRTLLLTNLVKHRKYESEYFDCDEFSLVLMAIMRFLFPGIAFGKVDVKVGRVKHSLNFFIDDKRHIFFVEPQDGKVSFAPVSKKFKPYRWEI